MSTIGKRIHSLRTSEKLTQDEFGLIFGVVKSTVSLYEHDKSTPNDELKIQMCKYFNVSMDFLVGLTDKKNETTQNEQSLTPKQEELLKTFETLSTTEIEKVLEFSRFLKSQRKTELD